MGLERIGLRRLYIAANYHQRDVESIQREVSLTGPLECSVYIGPRPLHGIWYGEDQFYALTSEDRRQVTMPNWRHSNDVDKTAYFGKTFAEVCVFLRVTIPDEASDAIRGDRGAARSVIVDVTDQFKELLDSAMDTVVGVLGLRVDPQLFHELVHEDRLVLLEGRSVPTFGKGFRILLSKHLDAHLRSEAEEALTGFGSFEVGYEALGPLILRWLKRAWEETDDVYRFTSLFIPLEMALSNIGTGPQLELRHQARAIRKCLKRYGADSSLLTFFNGLVENRKPTLEGVMHFSGKRRPWRA